MTVDEVTNHYKTGSAIAEVLGLTPGRVSQILSSGGFSYEKQCVMEIDSGGVLIARREDEPKSAGSAA